MAVTVTASSSIYTSQKNELVMSLSINSERHQVVLNYSTVVFETDHRQAAGKGQQRYNSSKQCM